jgi:hypothetical protein
LIVFFGRKGGIETALKYYEVPDSLRGSHEKITIRFDDKELTELPCATLYDAALSGEKGNRVRIIKKIEVYEDGVWAPYPVVTWIDGVEHERQLVTRVIAKLTGEKDFEIMASVDGVPDGILMAAAEDAKIYTEYFE